MRSEPRNDAEKSRAAPGQQRVGVLRASAAAAATTATTAVLGRLATDAVELAGRPPARPDEWVAAGVLGVGALAAAVLAAGCVLLLVGALARGLGRSVRCAEAAADRLTPAVLRRAVAVTVGAGLGLAAPLSSATAGEIDLGWAVTDGSEDGAPGSSNDQGLVTDQPNSALPDAGWTGAQPDEDPTGAAVLPATGLAPRAPGDGGDPATTPPSPGMSLGGPPAAAVEEVEVGDTGRAGEAGDVAGGAGEAGDVGGVRTDSQADGDGAAPESAARGGTTQADSTTDGAAQAERPSPAAAPGGPAGPPATEAGNPRTVTVEPGDSLWRIAAAHLPPGAPSAEIAAAWPRWYEHNRDVIGPDPDLIHPGHQLAVPTDHLPARPEEHP